MFNYIIVYLLVHQPLKMILDRLIKNIKMLETAEIQGPYRLFIMDTCISFIY